MSVQALPAEESFSLIHSLATLTASLATPQSAAVTAGCDRTWLLRGKRSDRILDEVRMRSPLVSGEGAIAQASYFLPNSIYI